jgi:hypothetical protein
MSGKNILDGSESRRHTANDQEDQGMLQANPSWLAIPLPCFSDESTILGMLLPKRVGITAPSRECAECV